MRERGSKNDTDNFLPGLSISPLVPTIKTMAGSCPPYFHVLIKIAQHQLYPQLHSEQRTQSGRGRESERGRVRKREGEGERKREREKEREKRENKKESKAGRRRNLDRTVWNHLFRGEKNRVVCQSNEKESFVGGENETAIEEWSLGERERGRKRE